MSRLHRQLAGFLIVALTLPNTPAVAGQNAPEANWDNLKIVKPGARVTVERFKAFGKNVKGSFVSYDEAGITIQTGKKASEGQVVIPREQVSKIKLTPKRTRWRAMLGSGLLALIWGPLVYNFNSAAGAVLMAVSLPLILVGAIGEHSAYGHPVYQAAAEPSAPPRPVQAPTK